STVTAAAPGPSPSRHSRLAPAASEAFSGPSPPHSNHRRPSLPGPRLLQQPLARNHPWPNPRPNPPDPLTPHPLSPPDLWAHWPSSPLRPVVSPPVHRRLAGHSQLPAQPRAAPLQ